MATQTRERDLVIETKQEVVQTIDLCQEEREGSLGTSIVHVQSGAQKTCQAIPDQRDVTLSSYRIRKALVRVANQLIVVYDMLVAPPATERGRVRNSMVKAKHDRFISFLR